MLRDQYVQRSGFSVSFRCIYPDKVKSYVKVAKWFVNKEPLKVAPKDNLVVKDVQKSDSDKLYFCVVVNILTNEMVASNVAKIFIRNSAGIYFHIFYRKDATFVHVGTLCIYYSDYQRPNTCKLHYLHAPPHS